MNDLDDKKEPQGLTPADRLPADRLVRWAEQPVGRVNRAAVVLALLGMVSVALASTRADEPIHFLRQSATLFIAGHGLVYVLWLRFLRRMRDRRKVGAARALEAYLDPRRISNLDLAMAWMAFFAVAPLLGSILFDPHPTGD